MAHLSPKGLGGTVVISRDEAFIGRLQGANLQSPLAKTTLTVFGDSLSALVHLLEHTAQVVLYDIDFDSAERNLQSLRAIRRACRNMPIILAASQHPTSAGAYESDVGIFYRIVKSAPNTELEEAISSARRFSPRWRKCDTPAPAKPGE